MRWRRGRAPDVVVVHGLEEGVVLDLLHRARPDAVFLLTAEPADETPSCQRGCNANEEHPGIQIQIGSYFYSPSPRNLGSN